MTDGLEMYQGENAPKIEPELPPTPPKKSFKTPLLIIVISALVVMGGLTFFLFQQKPTNSQENKSVTPTPTKSEQVNVKKSNWIKPTKVIYTDTSGDLYVSSLDGTDPLRIVQSKGKILGAPQYLEVSPKGRYVAYIQLPSSEIAEYQTNPPYEFHGSTTFELHIVDLKMSPPQDTLIANEIFSGLGENPTVAWDDSEENLFFSKESVMTNQEEKPFFKYNFASKSITETQLPPYLQDNIFTFSETKSYIAQETTQNQSRSPFITEPSPVQTESILTAQYFYNLYSKDGKLQSTLYQAQDTPQESEHILFADENTVFISREVFVNGPDSICYLEKLDIKNKKLDQLQKIDCLPGSSNTHYGKLKLSPNGKYLSSIFTEDTVATETTPMTQKSSIFLIDLTSGQKKNIAQVNEWYIKYFWLSEDRLLAVASKPYVIDIPTATSSLFTPFNGKTILEVF